MRATREAGRDGEVGHVMESAGRRRSFVERVIAAAKLDRSVYEEVEHDPEATRQAAALVVLGSIATGVAALGSGQVLNFAIGIVLGLVAWAVYAWIAYFVGTRLLAGPDTSASWSEVARTMGFAQAPRLLLVVSFVPVLGAVVGLVVSIWFLLTTVAALRAALDFGTGRAVATAILSWLPYAIVVATLLAAFGSP